MTRVSINNTRTVRINDLPDGRESRTPKGRVPIRCVRAEFSYNLDTGKVYGIEVAGYLVNDTDIARRAESMMSYGRERAATEILVRRYSTDWETGAYDAPSWLTELIEQYRPVPAVTA